MKQLVLSFALILAVSGLALNESSLNAQESASQDGVKSKAQSQQPSPKQLPGQTANRPPDQKTSRPQQNTNSEQRGTEQAPFVIQIHPTKQAQDEPSNDSDKRPNVEGNTWTLSQKIAAIASIGTLLQFFVLVGTLWVMILTAVRQLRAYVLPDNAGLIDGTMLDPPQPAHANQPGVFLTLRNSGRTPAYKVVSLAQIEVTQQINENNLTVPPLPDAFSAPLGAGGVMSKPIWYGRSLTPIEIADILNGHQAIYLYGRIEYTDAFKKKRFTNFRLRYTGQFPPLPNAIFFFCEKGNEAN